MENFHAVVNLFQDFIKQEQAAKPSCDATIAALTGKPDKKPPKKGNKNQKKFKPVKPDYSVPDKHYDKDEYKKLSLAQKYGLKLKREKKEAEEKKEKKVTFDKRTVKALVSAMKKHEDSGSDADSESSSDEESRSKKRKQANRNNKALKWCKVGDRN